LVRTAYTVDRSLLSAGAAFIAGLTMRGSLTAARAATHVAEPSADTRAMPLARFRGVAPVTTKPKYTLPRASTVSGVLMITDASYTPGDAS
jgi:hypothetical protein